MTRLDEIKQSLKMSIELNQLGPCNQAYQRDVHYLLELVERYERLIGWVETCLSIMNAPEELNKDGE